MGKMTTPLAKTAFNFMVHPLAPLHLVQHPAQPGLRGQEPVARAPGLDDADLAPGGMGPHREAGQLPVPEDGVLLDLQCLEMVLLPDRV